MGLVMIVPPHSVRHCDLKAVIQMQVFEMVNFMGKKRRKIQNASTVKSFFLLAKDFIDFICIAQAIKVIYRIKAIKYKIKQLYLTLTLTHTHNNCDQLIKNRPKTIIRGTEEL